MYKTKKVGPRYVRYFAEKTWHYIREHLQLAREALSTVHDTSRIAHECIKQTEINGVLGFAFVWKVGMHGVLCACVCVVCVCAWMCVCVCSVCLHARL